MNEVKKSVIIAVTTQKGGVGKTQTSVNIADAFVRRGKSVLLIDLDPQGNATSILYGAPASSLRFTSVDLLLDSDPTIVASCVTPSRIKGLDLVASNIRLARVAETDLIRRNTTTLRKRLTLLSDNYDIVIIDTPPSLGRLTANALCAATHYLVPLKGGAVFSFDGLDDLEATVKEAKEDNPGLTRLGVFFNMFDGRTNIAKTLLRGAVERLGKDLLETRIPISNVQFEESALKSQTVLEFERDGAPAKALVALSDELLERLGM